MVSGQCSGLGFRVQTLNTNEPRRHPDTLLVAVQHQQQRNQHAAMVSGQCSELGFRVQTQFLTVPHSSTVPHSLTVPHRSIQFLNTNDGRQRHLDTLLTAVQHQQQRN